MMQEDNPMAHRTSTNSSEKSKKAFFFFTVIAQFVLIILYVIFSTYGSPSTTYTDSSGMSEYRYYQKLMNVTIMIFIGFGFLMTFMKRYSFSAVGYTFLVSAFVIEWSMILNHFCECAAHGHWENLHINYKTLITGNFAAGAVMISFGAVLGKTSPIQMMLIGVLEIVFYSINVMVCEVIIRVADIGGSMLIHSFGAYFGIFMSLAFGLMKKPRETLEMHKEEFKSRYVNDIFAMIGTVFLWIYWPSFNGALAPVDQFGRCVINTVLSLVGCVVGAYAFSSILNKGRLEMVDIQNASIAGGVAVGATANFRLGPAGAMGVGFAVSCISCLGYRFLTPLMERKFNLHDTCGVHNLHGMPGVFGAIVSIIVTAVAPTAAFYPPDEVAALLPHGTNQFGYQIASLLITLAIACGGGFLTGLLIFPLSPEHSVGRDDLFWHVPDDFAELGAAPQPEEDDEMPKDAELNDLAAPSPIAMEAVPLAAEVAAV